MASDSTEGSSPYRSQGARRRNQCPRCSGQLQETRRHDFGFERCLDCHGVFVSMAEMFQLQKKALALAGKIENEGEPYDGERVISCPVCQGIMARKPKYQGSEITADVCARHGVWFDGSELGTFLKRYRRGGHFELNWFEKTLGVAVAPFRFIFGDW